MTQAQYLRHWRRQHPGKVNEYQRRWREKNRERYNAYQRAIPPTAGAEAGGEGMNEKRYQERKKVDQRKKQLKEMVKILQSCSKGDCDHCPYYGERCFDLVRWAMAEAAALLQKKEVMELLTQEAQA